MTHICVGNLTIIGPDNGLSPGRRQAIIWTNAGILLIGPWGTNFSKILIGIQTFSFKKMHLKISSAKWRPSCLGLKVLIEITTNGTQGPSYLTLPFSVRLIAGSRTSEFPRNIKTCVLFSIAVNHQCCFESHWFDIQPTKYKRIRDAWRNDSIIIFEIYLRMARIHWSVLMSVIYNYFLWLWSFIVTIGNGKLLSSCPRMRVESRFHRSWATKQTKQFPYGLHT